ncbi:MAG: DUF5615 family PIN-like protein [Candidatus Pacebacteria bacterium]|nr:DUF5615 family PIN-like protein [Candidatus Paceibacterota bacterium]
MKSPGLLLDENIGVSVAIYLRKMGWDVVSVLDGFSGITDNQVLSWAKRENRVIVTLDQDFGVLVFKNSNRHVGILLLKLKKESSKKILTVIVKVLELHGDKLKNNFIVASEYQIRMH